MMAIAAALTFLIGFILSLLGVSTGRFSLLYLGLALLALHFVVGDRLWSRRS